MSEVHTEAEERLSWPDALALCRIGWHGHGDFVSCPACAGWESQPEWGDMHSGASKEMYLGLSSNVCRSIIHWALQFPSFFWERVCLCEKYQGLSPCSREQNPFKWKTKWFGRISAVAKMRESGTILTKVAFFFFFFEPKINSVGSV